MALKISKTKLVDKNPAAVSANPCTKYVRTRAPLINNNVELFALSWAVFLVAIVNLLIVVKIITQYRHIAKAGCQSVVWRQGGIITQAECDVCDYIAYSRWQSVAKNDTIN